MDKQPILTRKFEDLVQRNVAQDPPAPISAFGGLGITKRRSRYLLSCRKCDYGGMTGSQISRPGCGVGSAMSGGRGLSQNFPAHVLQGSYTLLNPHRPEQR